MDAAQASLRFEEYATAVGLAPGNCCQPLTAVIERPFDQSQRVDARILLATERNRPTGPAAVAGMAAPICGVKVQAARLFPGGPKLIL
jgi:hypothetical protein